MASVFIKDADNADKAEAKKAGDIVTQRASAIKKSDDVQVRSYLVAAISNEFMVEIGTLKNAYDMWCRLSTRFYETHGSREACVVCMSSKSCHHIAG